MADTAAMNKIRDIMQHKFIDIGNALAGGLSVVASYFAGSELFWLLILFMAGDVVLGFLVALRKRTLSTDKMYTGGIKKCIILVFTIALMYADAFLLPGILGRDAVMSVGEFTLGGATAFYFALREFLSMAQHMADADAPLPQFLIEWARNLLEKYYNEPHPNE